MSNQSTRGQISHIVFDFYDVYGLWLFKVARINFLFIRHQEKKKNISRRYFIRNAAIAGGNFFIVFDEANQFVKREYMEGWNLSL